MNGSDGRIKQPQENEIIIQACSVNQKNNSDKTNTKYYIWRYLKIAVYGI